MKDQPGTSGNNDVITTEVELTEKKDAGKETLGTKQVCLQTYLLSGFLKHC